LALDRQERDESRHERDQWHQRQRRAPAGRAALDQPERQQRQRQHSQDLAGRIEADEGSATFTIVASRITMK
jgi:hypothetical protein